jgi:hypothetical protein
LKDTRAAAERQLHEQRAAAAREVSETHEALERTLKQTHDQTTGQREAHARLERAISDARAEIAREQEARAGVERALDEAKSEAVRERDARLALERERHERAAQEGDVAETHAALERERARANSLECERVALVAEIDSLREELRVAEASLAVRPPEPQPMAPQTPAPAPAPVPAPAATLPLAAPVAIEATPAAAVVTLQIDGHDAALVELSAEGAQVIAPRMLKPNQTVRLRLARGHQNAACKGKVVWAQLEPPSRNQSVQYRAGLQFMGADGATLAPFLR